MKRIILVALLLISFVVCFAQKKHALLIGIGNYPASSGWARIHGNLDIPIIREALTKQGFQDADIAQLIDAQATKSAIVSSLESLAGKAGKGDVIYIHFSGHGQQITDLNGDEDDMFDEAWIPYDASKKYQAGSYEGENHLVDDEINVLISNIRDKVTTVGKIVVVEPDASKRNAAYRFGADVVLNPHAGNLLSEALMLSDGKGYDAVIEASGDRASSQNSINLVARGGSVVFFGLYGMEFNLELNLFNLYWKDASVSAVCVPHGQFPAALRMATRLNLEEVITGMFPFEQAIEAFGEKEKGGHAKVMLEFGKRESNL